VELNERFDGQVIYAPVMAITAGLCGDSEHREQTRRLIEQEVDKARDPETSPDKLPHVVIKIGDVELDCGTIRMVGFHDDNRMVGLEIVHPPRYLVPGT